MGAGAAQHKDAQTRETQEETGPDSPHSAWNLQVLQTNPSNIKSNGRGIKWQAANVTSLWEQFDEDVDQILEAMLRGDTDKKLRTMTTSQKNDSEKEK